MSFSFSFSGEDIEDSDADASQPAPSAQQPPAATASAFPVQGKPLLPPTLHALDDFLRTLPSKVAYSTLDVDLGEQGIIQIPRRELWDVRVQLMAEEDASDPQEELEPGLGKHDVRTGIYEGGFKSWESSVDLVKVLATEKLSQALFQGPSRVVELGCGTGLPSLALFQWAVASKESSSPSKAPLRLTLADYNPTVLYLVTLPNFIIAWALQQRGKIQALDEAFSLEGELELGDDVLGAFKTFLSENDISLSFVSGGWCPEFVDLIYSSDNVPQGLGDTQTLVMGAETIYSPFALASFTETLLSILQRERAEQRSRQAVAVVAAKRLYFGVGGSLDDFVEKIETLGVTVSLMREETEGVRRGVVKCVLP
ncbi:putative s-adenosylmethionine-dependent methyltransferase-like protein [Phaeoacremonium minimum UCRPA7]|uniref:protein-histidine N-methyltransferase n=1 Tax=Phaeoacremonium minimum (strain UCR-PA7) TaxID=1286976 RepID=R8BC01_PHAM7|nr:putative s-adenosylmethionine-dependent methyltransferase-like protein [Phaeoacremonium minimum UCRPA7]EON96825.1 putative s-adenosylmethionine-dependent methyltransferase-like protein [Phaeoacremonium minimum UCRPA7]